jgi:RNA polymerase sigma-70 factor, ECF subfamily
MAAIPLSSSEWPDEDKTELVRRAKDRDPVVWAQWHDLYYPFVFRYARSRLASSQDAEDIASQVFLEAIKSIDHYQNRGRPILAWFYGIASNLVSRRYRESKRTVVMSLLPAVEELLAADQESSLVEASTLRSALGKLKKEHREVLILRFLLDLPTRDIARLLRKSEVAIYSLQVRATDALRRELGE